MKSPVIWYVWQFVQAKKKENTEHRIICHLLTFCGGGGMNRYPLDSANKDLVRVIFF